MLRRFVIKEDGVGSEEEGYAVLSYDEFSKHPATKDTVKYL